MLSHIKSVVQSVSASSACCFYWARKVVQFSQNIVLTLKAPITTAADDIHKIFFHCFSEKIRLDVSSESSARQRIHMKNQALFSWKD